MWLLVLLSSVLLTSEITCKDHVHRPFQYYSHSDDGTYNFAYDTGLYGAHSLHMEYRDPNGVTRGRYGYTDPWGKLRVIEYEAGPDGFLARGDVGPDGYPHDNAPPEARAKPTPLRMAGWDPENDPIKPDRESEDKETGPDNSVPERSFDRYAFPGDQYVYGRRVVAVSRPDQDTQQDNDNN